MERGQIIIRTSLLSILVNLVLVAFKMVVGLLSNSIAIVLDAVNNLSDAISSIITIVGTKLSQKEPDKEHPYGYGRIEYLTSVLMAAIILFAGASSLRESIDKLLHPSPAHYSATTLLIVAAAVVVKFFWGRYTKRTGERINAAALVASGSEALFDAVLSAATLGAALVSHFCHISLEGALGAVIAVIIIKAGVELLIETLNSIIGVRADRELTVSIKERIRQIPGVRGVYDLVLHSYGPLEMIGSVHVEVDDTATARDIHHLTHDIVEAVYEEFGIGLTVGIYAANTTDRGSVAIMDNIREIIRPYQEIIQFHGFYADFERHLVSFDIVVDFKAPQEQIRDEVIAKLQAIYPQYTLRVKIDSYYSD